MDGLSFKIRLIDEASQVLNNIGNSGIKMTAGIETEFEKVSSSMNRTAKTATETATSFSKLSGNTGNITVQSRLLANALSDEAGKLERAAEKARRKADNDSQAAKSAKEFYEGLKKQTMESDNVSDALKEQAAQALRVSESLDKAAKKSEEKAKAMEKSANAARYNASSVEMVAQADEKIYSSANKISSAEQKAAEALNKAEQEAKEYADAARNAADESNNLGKKGESTAQLLESAFMALGVERVLSKISDGFIACSKSAIEFESAITGVYKTVDGTDAQLEKISNDIKAMSVEIPSTTTEIAGVAESAGQLGIATNDITDFTKVMINLGEATNLSSDEAASSLAKFSNITGMSASEYENLGSAVVALGNNFATTEADIVAMSTRMASAGTLAGLTESDILGLATAMSSVGIEADAGGSAMSKLLSDIQIAVETGNDSLNDFASVAGMTVDQFSDLFENRAVDALSAFISGLNDVERNGQTATVILENMGITEVRLSNAVKSLANNSDGMSSAVRLAGEAWRENTALAQEAGTRYGTLESRLTIAKNAANNLKIAIGDSLNPVVGKLADVGTDAMVWLTDFCEENPVVVASIAGTVGALGTATGAITAVATAAKAAKSAMELFNVTLSAGKMIGIAGGIAAVGAVIGGLAYTFSSAEDEVEDYNGTLEQCKNELDNTAMAYENVCNMYGVNSEAAKNLASELDMLNAQYQKSGGVAEDYAQRLAESKEAFASFKAEYNEKISAVDDSWQSGMVAVAQLDALSEKAQLTNSDLDLMSNYADYLNDTFNCDIKVNYDTGELTGFDPNNIGDEIIRKSKDDRKQAALDQITNVDLQQEYMDTIKSAYDQEQKIKKIRDEIYKGANDPSYVNTTGYGLNDIDEGGILSENLKNTKKEIQDAKASFFEYFEAAGLTDKDAEKLLNYLEESTLGFDESKEAAKEATEHTKSYMDIASEAVSGVSENILKLSEEYEDVYNSAYESFQGQFGLFDEASMSSEAYMNSTVANAQAALDSQLAYWESYQANIEYISNITSEELGVTQAEYDSFMSYVRSGSPEAAGLLNDMISNIKNNNSEAVTDVIETQSEIDKIQQKTADATADWTTDYEKKLQDYLDEATKTIEKMDLSDTAKLGATNTVNSYANSILGRKHYAVSAAQSVVSEVQSVFSSFNISVPAVSVSGEAGTIDGYASGTTCAEPGLKLVGENGPELIDFRGGETVYNADETKSMIHDYADKPLYIPPVDSPVSRQIENATESVSRREISLNINGSGSVNITGGMNKEQVMEIMLNNLKPVLAGILTQEFFEEGEESYEY